MVLEKALGDRPDKHFRDGDDIWYHWYTFFPTNYGSDNRFQVWTQWHQQDLNRNGQDYVPKDCINGCSPVVEFTVDGADWGLRVLGHIAENDPTLCKSVNCGVKWTANIQQGHWYEMLLHVKWSKDPRIGFMELYVDRQKADPTDLDRLKHFATLEPDETDPDVPHDPKVYMKQGLYRDPSITIPQTVYHDGMTVVECKNPASFNYHPDTGTCNTNLPYQ